MRAHVPFAEMFGYSSEPWNLTSGRGKFSMHFERYKTTPFAIAEEISGSRRALALC